MFIFLLLKISPGLLLGRRSYLLTDSCHGVPCLIHTFPEGSKKLSKNLPMKLVNVNAVGIMWGQIKEEAVFHSLAALCCRLKEVFLTGGNTYTKVLERLYIVKKTTHRRLHALTFLPLRIPAISTLPSGIFTFTFTFFVLVISLPLRRQS